MAEEQLEIERKFLVKKLPDLAGLEPEEQERYFLEIGSTEKRITKINDKYVYEEKSDELFAKKVSKNITAGEFEKLKRLAIGSLRRKSYILSTNPEISIKIYDGDYAGLIRAEFGFGSEEEAKNFIVPDWVGNEITNTEIGRDGRLIRLNKEEFLRKKDDVI